MVNVNRMPDIFISRQPLVNRSCQIVAQRLSLRFAPGARAIDATDAASTLKALGDAWPPGEQAVFLDCGGHLPDVVLLDGQVPENVVFEVRSDDLLGETGAPRVAALLAARTPLALLVDAQAEAALACGLPFRFVGVDARRNPPPHWNGLNVPKASDAAPSRVAFNVDDEVNFRQCFDAGIEAAASWFFTRPAQTPARALKPGHARIVRLLNLVRSNANVKEVEAALKQDVALSYKFLRYINSPGFGLSCEIQSFRHAVTILGYDNLNKWLALLLATASRDPMAPALLHTALTRAHLMEELAQGRVEARDYDSLFVTGAFSLLDVLLGVSMGKVLEALHLPEAISDALLGRGGRYAPFLDLARAGEGEDGAAIAAQAARLGVSAEQFNRAQLRALAFAASIEL